MSNPQLHVFDPAGELRTVRRLTPLLALALAAGCYTYRPLSAPIPAPGTRVQADLTDAGSDSLAGRVGPSVQAVDGTVLRADSSGLALAVREVENRRGERSDWQGETLVIPRRFVRNLQERRISVGGTGLLGGAIAAGLVAATQAFGGRGTLEGNPGGAPGSGGH
jgi:hypothetical protein